MKKINIILLSILLSLMIGFSPRICYAEKSMWDHVRIWGTAGLNAFGLNPLVKLGGLAGKELARVLKPQSVESWSQTGEQIVKGKLRIDDVQKKLEDPTGAGWLIWSATTAAEVGSTILETAVPAVRIGKAALNVGYSYYRNWQDEWMDELKKMPKPPYTPILLPPELPEIPVKPANDKPDDYKGIIDMRLKEVPQDELQRLLKEYDELCLNYLAFEIGMSIDNPVMV